MNCLFYSWLIIVSFLTTIIIFLAYSHTSLHFMSGWCARRKVYYNFCIKWEVYIWETARKLLSHLKGNISQRTHLESPRPLVTLTIPWLLHCNSTGHTATTTAIQSLFLLRRLPLRRLSFPQIHEDDCEVTIWLEVYLLPL